MSTSDNPVLAGNIRKQIILLTLPLIAGELLQQLYNTVDSLIIGQYLGTDAFAASGISGSIMNLFIFILSGFCVGVSVMFSGEYGAGQLQQFRKTHYTTLVFGSIITIILSVIFILLTNPVLRLIATPDELMGYCREYLTVILAGLIATFFNNLYSGILRAVGATSVSLIFLTVSLGSNVALDFLFIAALPFGIIGAAVATIMAQGISACCCYIYLRRHYPELIFQKEDAAFYPDILKKSLGYGFSTALHMSSLYIGKFLVQGIVNLCGTAAIAAFTATTRIEAFISSPGNGFAQAVSIFIAQNRGAGKPERVKRGMRDSFMIMMACAVTLSTFMYIIAPYALRLFLNASETASLVAGTAYLKIIFFFYVLSYMGYFFVGTSRGYGKMTIPFVATTIQISIRVVCSFFLVKSLGLSAVAWATGIGWVAIVLFHFANFRRYTEETNRAVS